MTYPGFTDCLADGRFACRFGADIWEINGRHLDKIMPGKQELRAGCGDPPSTGWTKAAVHRSIPFVSSSSLRQVLLFVWACKIFILRAHQSGEAFCTPLSSGQVVVTLSSEPPGPTIFLPNKIIPDSPSHGSGAQPPLRTSVRVTMGRLSGRPFVECIGNRGWNKHGSSTRVSCPLLGGFVSCVLNGVLRSRSLLRTSWECRLQIQKGSVPATLDLLQSLSTPLHLHELTLEPDAIIEMPYDTFADHVNEKKVMRKIKCFMSKLTIEICLNFWAAVGNSVPGKQATGPYLPTSFTSCCLLLLLRLAEFEYEF